MHSHPETGSGPGLDSELIRQVAGGDAARVADLLERGANPDTRAGDGESLLRLAARAGYAETAACLLMHGADFRATDASGIAALDPEAIGLPTLHRIRQEFHRYRLDRARRRPFADPQAEAWAGTLERQGIARLGGLVTGQLLREMQVDFARFVDGLNARILRREAMFRRYDDEEHFWPRDRAYVSNNAFKYSAALARFCCRPDLLAVVRDYLGRPPQITRGVAMRYLPDSAKERDMFGWHHDLEDRRLKLQILLTDVGPADQYMSYLAGSHRLCHPYEMFLDNRCSLDYVRERLGEFEVVESQGRAGDVFLFDSNGAHRGNRKPGGAVRDAFFVEYSGDRSDVWGGDLAPAALDELVLPAGDPFTAFRAAQPKWLRPMTRRAPSWAENLPDIGSWARPAG